MSCMQNKYEWISSDYSFEDEKSKSIITDFFDYLDQECLSKELINKTERKTNA